MVAVQRIHYLQTLKINIPQKHPEKFSQEFHETKLPIVKEI